MLLINLKVLDVLSYAVKQPSQYSSGLQPFPGAEAYGKIPANDSSGSRLLLKQLHRRIKNYCRS